MHLRRIAQLVFLAFAVGLFFSSTGYAAPLDKAANKKIDDAINIHYLGTDFKKALGVLEGTIEACGEKCSPAVLGRAWMYIGIVKGAGLSNMKGAEEAFATALSIDPNVKLDKDLASEELVALFEESGGDSSGTAAPPTAAEPSPPPGLASGEMTCTPDISELELRRPIPVACRSSKPATKAVIHYKEFGAPSYSQVTMTLSGSDWLGTVPCTATALQGEFSWFVVTSGSGGMVDSYGSEGEPNVISVVQSTTEAPPAHPGKPAPEACADAEDCPEEMRGTPTCPDVAAPSDRGDKGWGAGCKKHQECEVGLYCLAGSCESPPACETGADCDSGICEEFLCKILEDDDGGGGGGGGDKGPTNFIGLSFGLDLAAISGDFVCNPNPLTQVDAAGAPVPLGTGQDAASAPPSTFTCYVGEEPYAVHPYADQLSSGSIPSTLGPGTMRIFLSYEHVFAEQFGIEAQAGLGLRGSPVSGVGQLIHAAVFGKYWFAGTGEGFRLYGALGGGLGQVDATADVSVVEYGSSLPVTQGGDANSTPAVRDPWATTYCGGATTACPITPVRAYKSLGQSFVGAGIGGLLNLGAIGIDIRLLGKFMLPVTGVVIQPTAGVVLPF